MQTRQLGSLWPVSALTLGGGGIGQVWGETSRAEAVETVRHAVESGITLLIWRRDMAGAKRKLSWEKRFRVDCRKASG